MTDRQSQVDDLALELFDTTIIGGGPGGLYAAFYSGMRDMKTKLIEAQNQLGGKLLIYPEKMIWDVGGVTPVRCEQFIAQLIEQAQTFEPTIVLGQQIADLQRLSDGTLLLTSESGERHRTKTVILTVGYGVPLPAKLEIEGADRYELANLHYTVTSMERFRGKRVLLSGGSDTAVDWAMELESIASSLTMVHRREKLGGHEWNARHVMESPTITVMNPYVIGKLHGEAGRIVAVTLEQTQGSEHVRLDVDEVIINHGYPANHGGLQRWGLEQDYSRFVVGQQMATNLPGVFAAGDAASYDHKLSLIAGAFQDAAQAVNGAKLYMEPQAMSMAYVSSHNAIFHTRNAKLIGSTQA